MPRIRRPADRSEWAAATVVAVVAVWLVIRLLQAALDLLLAAWWVLAALAGGACVTLWAIGRSRTLAAGAAAARLARLRLTLVELDALSPTEFELAVRDLMIRDGLAAQHVGRRGDQAADVKARDPITGRTIVVQCKHTTTAGKVGAPVIYQVNGTAGPAHGADLAVVVTNGAFTRDARAQATAFRIALIDRHTLQRWAHHGTGLRELLALDTRLRSRRYRLRHRG
jgi:restriction system protein